MRWTGLWVVAALLVAAGPVLGQGGRQSRGVRGVGVGPGTPGVAGNVAIALQRADELGLDEAQVQELRAIQEQLAAVRRERDQELQAFRQRLREEDRTVREERRSEIQALRQRRTDALREFPERYEELLTDGQRSQVRELARDDARRARRARVGFQGPRDGGFTRTRAVRAGGGRVTGIRARVQANRARVQADRVRVRANRIPVRAGRLQPRAQRIRRNLPLERRPGRRTGPGLIPGGDGSGPASVSAPGGGNQRDEPLAG